MSESVKAKALRLLAEGKVGDRADAYRVVGDHGTHTVIAHGQSVAYCTCPAVTGCAHEEAVRILLRCPLGSAERKLIDQARETAAKL